MLHTAKANRLKMQWTWVLCAFLFAAVPALLPTSALAQCKNWDAGGTWKIVQRGQKDYLFFNLKQNGRVVTGDATMTVTVKGKGGDFDGETSMGGTIDGTIDGDRFSVQIFWGNGDTGIYNANVLPSGRLDGEGYEKRSPNVRVPWHSEGVLNCATPPVKPSVSPKSAGSASPTIPMPGKAPKSTSAPPPPMKIPGIAASQAVFEHPSAFSGFVMLTWDGGPDHPYAEVWVKVNSGDDTFVVEQGKGDRRVEVERGKTYEYILTDAGKTLATVSFTAY